MNDRSLSSPNRMVWQYADGLRRIAYQAGRQGEGDLRKQDIAVCVFLAVTVVESFVNLFFRILIDKPEHSKHRLVILRDLSRRASLEHKLRSWPELVFGRGWDLSSGAGKDFYDLKERRNALMHFTSTHESVTAIPGVLIHGMADTTAYDSLRPDDAALSVRVAEASICALLEVAGYSPEAVEKGLHYWTGKVPASFLPTPEPSPAEGDRVE